MSEIANEIEALLFLYAKELTPKAIAKLLNRKEKEINKGIVELKRRYAKREGAIMLRKMGKSFSLNVKPEYAEKLKEVIKKSELSPKELKILALVKKYNGILKAKIVKALGNWVYETIAGLKKKGFIIEKKAGRSYRLALTEKFKDYFGEI